MKNYHASLEKCPLFKGIKAEDISKMLVCLDARVKRYDKNQFIFTEGDTPEYVGIVLSGEVRIIKEDYYGRVSLVANIPSGGLFAEAFACAGIGALPVSAEASSESETMLIDVKRIIGSCSNACVFHASLINNLLRVVAEKNILLNRKIEFTSKRTTKDKLMSYLLAEAKEAQGSTFSIPLDRKQLADYLGVERSAMSAELGKLKRDGKIDFKKNCFRIL